MLDTYVYIIEDFLFFCLVLMLLYLFVLTIASHFKPINHPTTKHNYRCAIVVSEASILPSMYKDEPYEFIIYKDIMQTIQSLDEEQYDVVILLSDTVCSFSPLFLKKICNTYDAGVKVMQLHAVTTNRIGLKNYFRTLSDEIDNSILRAGNTQLGFSSALFGTNMAIDLNWLKRNMKSVKTNLERKLFKQHVYIGYLSDAIVYCQSAPVYPYRKRIKKVFSFLLPSFIERNWSLFNRTVQQLLPSPQKMYIIVAIWTVLITAYDWTLSIKWWLAFFGLTVIFSLAIPNYLIEEKKKKKRSIWRRSH